MRSRWQQLFCTQEPLHIHSPTPWAALCTLHSANRRQRLCHRCLRAESLLLQSRTLSPGSTADVKPGRGDPGPSCQDTVVSEEPCLVALPCLSIVFTLKQGRFLLLQSALYRARSSFWPTFRRGSREQPALPQCLRQTLVGFACEPDKLKCQQR